MTPTVADIIKLMETVAPPHLAEAWDNCGLQVGKRQWPVKHIRTALDPLPQVVTDAAEAGVDFLMTHHPLIFKPVKQVDFDTELGRIIQQSAADHMAVYAAHTNLDKAAGGLNDTLAEMLGLDAVGPLISGRKKDRSYKLVFFVPTAHVQAVTEVLVATGAGRIGHYSGCTFRTEGMGTFIPGPGTTPYSGKHDRLNEAVEARIEAVADSDDIDPIITAVQAVHPYESMAYDIYPVVTHGQPGLGRVGTLKTEMELGVFADHVLNCLDLAGGIRLVGDPRRNIQKVAICTGSGSSLTGDFLSSGADVYVSGDMHYHDARTIEGAGLGLVDIGHFASEQIMVAAVADLLRRKAAAAGYDVVVSSSQMETDPFTYI